MKYNVKAIMARAWEIKKQDMNNYFGLCLRMAWEEAKAPKQTKNVVVETYESFNFRRFSQPWVALVDENGRLDFSSKVGAYTGAYGKGEAGELYVYAPIDGRVYAYGQKDYRGNHGGYRYAQYIGGRFVVIEKTELLKAIA